jgi:membrane protein
MTQTIGSEMSDSAEDSGATPVGKGKRPKLPAGAWNGIVKRTLQGFQRDNLTDVAAALTYYGVLSIFPGLLVLVSALRVFGAGTSSTVVKNVVAIAPGGVGNTLDNAVKTLQQGSHGTATLLVVVGLVGALWSASGYVGAFMRAANRIYDVPEGRPFWKIAPVRILLTISAGVILTAASLSIALTGKLATAVGDAIGLGHEAVTVWNIAKWPVLLVIISLLFAVLYWAAPNARTGRFRWISVGSLTAVAIWLVASLAFAFYVANFASYNRVYGSLATIIVFLVWLWISNIALLLGAELDSEVQRARAIGAGHPATAEPYLPLRDTTKVSVPVVESPVVESPAANPTTESPTA